MPQRIKSLVELRNWNRNPTEELPIVFEWFFEWFFDKGVKGNYVESLHEMLVFAWNCNGKDRCETERQLLMNLGSMADRMNRREEMRMLAVNVPWIRDAWERDERLRL